MATKFTMDGLNKWYGTSVGISPSPSDGPHNSWTIAKVAGIATVVLRGLSSPSKLADIRVWYGPGGLTGVAPHEVTFDLNVTTPSRLSVSYKAAHKTTPKWVAVYFDEYVHIYNLSTHVVQSRPVNQKQMDDIETAPHVFGSMLAAPAMTPTPWEGLSFAFDPNELMASSHQFEYVEEGKAPAKKKPPKDAGLASTPAGVWKAYNWEFPSDGPLSTPKPTPTHKTIPKLPKPKADMEARAIKLLLLSAGAATTLEDITSGAKGLDEQLLIQAEKLSKFVLENY